MWVIRTIIKLQTDNLPFYLYYSIERSTWVPKIAATRFTDEEKAEEAIEKLLPDNKGQLVAVKVND